MQGLGQAEPRSGCSRKKCKVEPAAVSTKQRLMLSCVDEGSCCIWEFVLGVGDPPTLQGIGETNSLKGVQFGTLLPELSTSFGVNPVSPDPRPLTLRNTLYVCMCKL